MCHNTQYAQHIVNYYYHWQHSSTATQQVDVITAAHASKYNQRPLCSVTLSVIDVSILSGLRA